MKGSNKFFFQIVMGRSASANDADLPVINNQSDHLLIKRLLKLRALKNFAIGDYNGRQNSSNLNDVIIEETSSTE